MRFELGLQPLESDSATSIPQILSRPTVPDVQEHHQNCRCWDLVIAHRELNNARLVVTCNHLQTSPISLRMLIVCPSRATDVRSFRTDTYESILLYLDSSTTKVPVTAWTKTITLTFWSTAL